MWGSSLKTAPGSLSTGSPAGRTPPHGDGSMYSQTNVRAGKVLQPPIRALPSVIVDTEKVLREAGEPVGRAALTAHFGWKGVRSGVRLESRSGEPVRSPKNTSAARNSFDPGEGRFSKNYGANQQRLQISDLHFDKFPNPATVACWKMRFKTEVCTCSQFPTEAVHWIKEVEMVDSVDDLKSSSSTSGISMPNFEELDARIASALNKIIHNSQFKRRISLEEQKAHKEDRFPSRHTDCT